MNLLRFSSRKRSAANPHHDMVKIGVAAKGTMQNAWARGVIDASTLSADSRDSFILNGRTSAEDKRESDRDYRESGRPQSELFDLFQELINDSLMLLDGGGKNQ